MLTLATVLVGYALSKHSETLFDNIRQHQTQQHTMLNKAEEQWNKMADNKRRTVDDNGDTVRQSGTIIAIQRNTEQQNNSTVVKNQHWAGKWAVPEKRSTDFYGYS